MNLIKKTLSDVKLSGEIKKAYQTLLISDPDIKSFYADCSNAKKNKTALPKTPKTVQDRKKELDQIFLENLTFAGYFDENGYKEKEVLEILNNPKLSYYKSVEEKLLPKSYSNHSRKNFIEYIESREPKYGKDKTLTVSQMRDARRELEFTQIRNPEDFERMGNEGFELFKKSKLRSTSILFYSIYNKDVTGFIHSSPEMTGFLLEKINETPILKDLFIENKTAKRVMHENNWDKNELDKNINKSLHALKILTILMETKTPADATPEKIAKINRVKDIYSLIRLNDSAIMQNLCNFDNNINYYKYLSKRLQKTANKNVYEILVGKAPKQEITEENTKKAVSIINEIRNELKANQVTSPALIEDSNLYKKYVLGKNVTIETKLPEEIENNDEGINSSDLI